MHVAITGTADVTLYFLMFPPYYFGEEGQGNPATCIFQDYLCLLELTH